MKKSLSAKKIISAKRIISGLLLVLWMVVIFVFSSMDGTQSSLESSEVTHTILYFFGWIGVIDSCNITPDEVMSAHSLIRSLAHFFEYLVLGVLAYVFFSDIFKNKIIKIIIVSIVFCIIYAITDEVHQIFVPGRSGNIVDVLIDTAGGTVGILLTHAAVSIVSKHRKKVKIK